MCAQGEGSGIKVHAVLFFESLGKDGGKTLRGNCSHFKLGRNVLPVCLWECHLNYTPYSLSQLRCLNFGV